MERIWGWTSEGLDGLDGVDQGGGSDGLVVDSEMRSCNHDDDEADDVQPHGSVSQPAKALQAANATEDYANGHEDDHAGDEADLLTGELGDGNSISENQHAHSHKLLQGLSYVDEVTGERAIDTEIGITKAEKGIPGGVETKEDLP